MRDTLQISYIQGAEIDREKWDQCIASAPNGLIYSFSYYLDHMAEHWDALVMEDYHAVMPLPWKSKLKLSYLYQPFLTAQLGITGRNINDHVMRQFLDAIPKQFKLWEFFLNYGNVFSIAGYQLYQRKNFVLDLLPDYTTLYDNYRDNTKRNIKKSKQFGCRIKRGVTIDDVILLAGGHDKAGSMRDFHHFRNLYSLLNEKGKAKIYGICDSREELLACCVFFFSHNRAYYILVGNHPNGRTLGASHALVDAFITDYAGQNLLLDFEGSDIASLAFFYSSFGAVEEKYAAIKKNELPWYVKWWKQ